MEKLGSYAGKAAVCAFALLASAPRVRADLCADYCSPAVDCTDACEVCAPPYSPDGACLHGTRWTTCARGGPTCCASRSWVYYRSSNDLSFVKWLTAPNGDAVGCRLQSFYRQFERETCSGQVRQSYCAPGGTRDLNCISSGQACWDECDYYASVGAGSC